MNELKRFLDSFHPLTAQTWKKITGIFVQRKLIKDLYFVEEGECAKQIAFLEKGVVRAFYRNEMGKEYTKHFFLPPTMIGGYSSLITGEQNVINQQALDDCVIWVTNYADLEALYSSCPDLAIVARKFAEYYFVEKEKREIELVLLNANERYELLRQRIPHLESIVNQYHIASYLGVTPTQLSRIRKKLN